jgi:hypothetical protein
MRLKISNQWNTEKLIGIRKYLPSTDHKDRKKSPNKSGIDVEIIVVDRKMSALIDESAITGESSALTKHIKGSLNVKEEIIFLI